MIRRKGFTLIELLVVIAVIGLLVSILLPSLSRAMDQAKLVKCSANLHHIGKAAYLYAADNRSYVMRDSSVNQKRPGHELWAAMYAPYLGGQEVTPYERHWDEAYLTDLLDGMDVYRCPKVDDPEYKLHYLINGLDFDEYVSSGGNRWTYGPAFRTDWLPTPSQLLYITEGNFDVLKPDRQLYAYDIFSKGHVTFNQNGQANNKPRMIHAEDMRHRGQTTIVFFDGHAEPRELTPEDLPFRLFNPLHEEYND